MISLCAVNEIRTRDQRSDRMRFLNNFLRFRLISGLYFVKKILYGHKNYRDLFGENHCRLEQTPNIHIPEQPICLLFSSYSRHLAKIRYAAARSATGEIIVFFLP